MSAVPAVLAKFRIALYVLDTDFKIHQRVLGQRNKNGFRLRSKTLYVDLISNLTYNSTFGILA